VSRCEGQDHLLKMLKKVLLKGGEGIMLRRPNSMYEHGRSHSLLKVKHFHDEEAKVTGMEKGTGRLSALMGKLHVVLPTGVAFKVGTGFSDDQRRRPPKIGSVITFKYQELSAGGHPRFPVFLRERPELTWEDVLAAARKNPPFSSLRKRSIPLLQKRHSILFSTVPSRDQESGKKVIGEADADDDIEEEAKKGNLLTTGSTSAAASSSSAAASSSSSGKELCQYWPKCFRKNAAHLAKFDHPALDTVNDSDDDDGDGGDDKKADADFQPDKATAKATAAAAAASSSDEPRAKRARRDTPSTSPAPPSPAKSADSSSSSSTKVKRDCWYGADCYNSDPAHHARFAHPPPSTSSTAAAAASTGAGAGDSGSGYIEVTNMSQHDLSEYYRFGGDEDDDDEVDGADAAAAGGDDDDDAMLVPDKNESNAELQKFNENKIPKDQGFTMQDEEEEEKDAAAVAPAPTPSPPSNTTSRPTAAKRKRSAATSDSSASSGPYDGCASDDDDSHPDLPLVVSDLPRRTRTGGTRAPSLAAAVPGDVQRKPTLPLRQPSTRRAVVAATDSILHSSPSSSSSSSIAKKCPFILPELLLARGALTVENADGDLVCKKCKQEVGDHRETRA